MLCDGSEFADSRYDFAVTVYFVYPFRTSALAATCEFYAYGSRINGLSELHGCSAHYVQTVFLVPTQLRHDPGPFSVVRGRYLFLGEINLSQRLFMALRRIFPIPDEDKNKRNSFYPERNGLRSLYPFPSGHNALDFLLEGRPSLLSSLRNLCPGSGGHGPLDRLFNLSFCFDCSARQGMDGRV
jgi:hypothetical protein